MSYCRTITNKDTRYFVTQDSSVFVHTVFVSGCAPLLSISTGVIATWKQRPHLKSDINKQHAFNIFFKDPDSLFLKNSPTAEYHRRAPKATVASPNQT